MKKKFLTLSVIMCMALSVVACGKEKIADPEVPQAAIADLADEEIEEVTEDLDYDDETEVAEESSENYVLCGTLYSSMKYQSGEFDEYGKIQAIIYDGGLEDDTFTLVGTVYFKNTKDQDPVGVMPEDVNTFKVDKNTKYQMVGGELGTVDVSREEFEINFKACLDSGLYFEVEIVDGVATTIQICS